MKIKITLKKQFFIALISTIIILFSLLYMMNTIKTIFFPKEDVYAVQEKNMDSIRLRIPKIHINARVESVGLTELGLMDSPKNPSNTGWYNKGPYPGEKGSSVMDGHSGWKNNIPAVFDNLDKLVEGDKIYVDQVGEDAIVFVVREVRIYKADDDASDVFLSDDDKSHLNLITCDGVWDSVRNNHVDRLVVFADRE